MSARSEEYYADKIITKEGDNKHRMYIVLEGKVILYSNYQTKDEYIIGVYGKGKSFGEFDLFSEVPTMYTAVAYTNVKVAWFEKSNLEDFVNGYPNYALNLLETMAHSYINLAKNLKLAIEEISTLRQISDQAAQVAPQLDIETVKDALNNMS